MDGTVLSAERPVPESPPIVAANRRLTHAQHVAIGLAKDEYLRYHITYRELMRRIERIEAGEDGRRQRRRRRLSR